MTLNAVIDASQRNNAGVGLFVETPALAMARDMTFDQFMKLKDEPDHFERVLTSPKKPEP